MKIMRIAFIEFLETGLSHSLRVYICCSVNWNDDAQETCFRHCVEAVISAFVTLSFSTNDILL